MKDDITFSFKLDLKDYRNYNLFYFYGGVRRKITLFFLLCISNFSIIYFIYLMIYRNETTVFYLIAPFFLFLLPALILFQTKTIFKSDKLLSSEQHYTVNDKGFTIKNDFSNAKISWDKIFSVKEDRNYLFIFIARNKAFILPKKNMTRYVVKIKKLLFDNLEKKKLKIKKIGAVY
jgi:hypothetical protein